MKRIKKLTRQLLQEQRQGCNLYRSLQLKRDIANGILREGEAMAGTTIRELFLMTEEQGEAGEEPGEAQKGGGVVEVPENAKIPGNVTTIVMGMDVFGSGEISSVYDVGNIPLELLAKTNNNWARVLSESDPEVQRKAYEEAGLAIMPDKMDEWDREVAFSMAGGGNITGDFIEKIAETFMGAPNLNFEGKAAFEFADIKASGVYWSVKGSGKKRGATSSQVKLSSTVKFVEMMGSEVKVGVLETAEKDQSRTTVKSLPPKSEEKIPEGFDVRTIVRSKITTLSLEDPAVEGVDYKNLKFKRGGSEVGKIPVINKGEGDDDRANWKAYLPSVNMSAEAWANVGAEAEKKFKAAKEKFKAAEEKFKAAGEEDEAAEAELKEAKDEYEKANNEYEKAKETKKVGEVEYKKLFKWLRQKEGFSSIGLEKLFGAGKNRKSLVEHSTPIINIWWRAGNKRSTSEDTTGRADLAKDLNAIKETINMLYKLIEETATNEKTASTAEEFYNEVQKNALKSKVKRPIERALNKFFESGDLTKVDELKGDISKKLDAFKKQLGEGGGGEFEDLVAKRLKKRVRERLIRWAINAKRTPITVDEPVESLAEAEDGLTDEAEEAKENEEKGEAELQQELAAEIEKARKKKGKGGDNEVEGFYDYFAELAENVRNNNDYIDTLAKVSSKYEATS